MKVLSFVGWLVMQPVTWNVLIFAAMGALIVMASIVLRRLCQIRHLLVTLPQGIGGAVKAGIAPAVESYARGKSVDPVIVKQRRENMLAAGRNE